jgi:3-hydroxyisobutyrate dehydrogenase-like beta-hydroxyacid dehydrogenase
MLQQKIHQTPIGIIGLGLMGAALAERLIGSGHSVIGFDLVAQKRTELEALGGVAARSAAEIAERADPLLFSVMNTEQIEQSLTQIGDALRSNATIIDATTGSPDRMAELGHHLQQRGIAYVDATIAGNSDEARRGEVIVLAGGDSAVFERCRPLFACFARKAFHLGPCGAGASMKLVFNLALGLNRAVLAEALAFAEVTGVDPSQALDVMREGAAYSRVMDVKGPKMLARDYKPQARLAQHLKDVRLILDLARQRDANVPMSRLHAKLLTDLVDAGLGDLDNSAVREAFRTKST